MEPLALPSSSPTGAGHHLHRPLLHSGWGFQSGSPSAPVPPPDMETGSSYEASVVATSLLPPSDAWSHHPMLATPAPAPTHWIKQEEDHGVNGGAHDDSGISPGRTSSSGPSSSGGSPPANSAARAAAPSPSNKNENQDVDEDCRSSPVTQDDDSSDISEDTMDSLSRLQMALSQSGSPLGDIYNGSDDQNPVIQCPLCSQVTNSLPALAAHLSSHVEQKSSGSETSELQCPVCNFATPNKEEFLSHISSHYSNNDNPSKPRSSRRCSVCDFTTKSSSKLRSHLAEVHGFAPGENDLDMTDEDATTPRVNSQGKVKTFRCKQCNFVAVTKMDFWAHSRSHIKGEKVLSCPRCPFVTEYKHHLEYHLRNHSGSKPFKCSQCSYSCVNKSMLNSHLKSHSNVYQYRCADCNYATKYCHSLKLHLRKYTHAPAMVLNPDGSPNPLPIIDVYGTRRGPKTKKDPNLESQIISSATKQDKSVMSLIPSVQPSQAYLNEVTEDPHKCAQCDFSTSSQEHFAQHLLTAHTSNGNSKSRSPAILIPTPEKVMQQSHPLLIPQNNPMKDYLSWMYAQQQHAMDLYQQYKGSALPEPVIALAPDPLDLSKEVKKGEAEILVNNNNNNNNIDSLPTPPPTNKNRRKGKAFKLERIPLQDDVDDDVQPPPSKVRNTEYEREASSVTPPPTTHYLSPKPTHSLLSPKSLSNGAVKNLSDPSNEERKSPVTTDNGAPPSLALTHNPDAQPTYNCSYCDILFKDVVMYTMHMGYHGYKDPFHCNMCGQQTSDKLSFFLHIARSSHS